VSAVALDEPPRPANDTGAPPSGREAAVGAAVSGREPEAANPTRAHLGQAIRARDVTRLPGRRDEAWRWTDLRGVVRVLPPASGAAAAPRGAGPFDAAGAMREVRVLNGCGDAEALTLAHGEVVALRFVASGAGAHACELLVRVAPGASAVLLESYEGEGAYLAAADLQISLGEGAALERLVVQADGAEAITVSTADVRLAPGARFAQTVATTGARLQRHETRLVHPGEGASARMDAVYVLRDRHADLTSVVEHRGADGATSQMAKGVAAGRARAVFQGRIVVAPGADGTDARLRHDALLLNEGAEVNSKPELEIYADDVQCAHGNTVGALDDEQLFYIRSRGIGEGEAKALLMRAFLGEVVERVEHEGAREALAAWLDARLEALA
jgi:Fe-S cluster assembly protein SufD